ncbi:MAG: hypothetical protein LW687_12260 [Burkholderiaceae bacterium]|nr:hypothetical protein [Burkholderiaceae bacterium]MCE2925925.1 hypothetical protein [Phycisphaeraceae bacterium]
MEKELTNEELALWCEDMGKVFVEVAAKHPGDVRALPVRNAFTIIAERLRKPPDSSRVRETAKELPEGGYGVRVLAFDRRCQQWQEADAGRIRGMEREHPGKNYYTHWMPYPPTHLRPLVHPLAPLPPAPKEASDVG